MHNKVSKARTFCVIFFLFQLLLLVAFGIFYFLNLFETKSIVKAEYIYIALAAFLVIDILIITINFANRNKASRQASIKASELIGGDIQEAYNFGMIGLAVVDEHNKVLWTNELFEERKINLLDLNIVEWAPELEELQTSNSDKVVKLTYNSRNYDVKFLYNAGLYIFKDTTEFETISDYSKKQAVVVGIIMIDNYSDLAGTADDSNDVISKVRNAIFDYAKEYNLLLRRYRNDGYFLLCNYASLKNMEDNKFSLLQTIHEIGEKEDTPPTLSIGIAHDFPDVVKLNDMANNAIDIAMSRGGDQVVVSQYGEELQFFGGKSEAQENRNKVKVRVMADSVLSLIRNSANVLIMGHMNTDMDAMGACLGMKAICDYCKKPVQIIYDSKNCESKTKGAILSTFSREESNEIFISPSDAMDKLKSTTLVIVCDVHRPSMVIAPAVVEKANKVMIIDHHRRSEDYIESPVFSYIEPSASSACEMVTELIKYSSTNPRIELPSEYATFMLSGIFMDSNFFKAKACGIRTFEASMILKEYNADNALADDFLKDEFEEYALINKIMSTIQTPYTGVTYCKVNDDYIVESATLAKVANQCMQMKGVNAAFVIGKTAEKEVRISCRSDGTINVQLLAEKLNGGGHFTQAAGSFKNATIDRVETQLLDVLEEYLSDARSNN